MNPFGNYLVVLGIPIGVVVGVFLALQYSRSVAFLLRQVAFLGKWIRRKTLAIELEGDVNSFAKHFNTEFASEVMPECRIQWVNEKSVEHALAEGKAILKLSFSKEDQDLNFYNATQAFVATSFLHQTKPYVKKAIATAINLLMTKLILIERRPDALRLFNQRFGDHDDVAKECFEQLVETEERGLFKQLFILELFYFGQKLGISTPNSKHHQESEQFLAWFYTLATRVEKQLVVLSFTTEHIKVGVILVADSETYNRHGFKPYLRRAYQYATMGCQTLYILARGSFRSEMTDAIVERLLLNGGFEKISKRTHSVKTPDGRLISNTCVRLRPNVMQIEKSAWDSIDNAFKENGHVAGIVEAIEHNSLQVDLYGLKISLALADLSSLEIRDARRFFYVDEVLDLRVVKLERLAGILVVTNVNTSSDPKNIVEDVQQVGTVIRKGKVTKILQSNGYEYALILSFDYREGHRHCFVHRKCATFSTFLPLSKIYEDGQSVDFKITKFNPETSQFEGAIEGLIDPWALPHSVIQGNNVSCVIRQITELHVTCELPDGKEGAIHVDELSWGSRACY